ncbi:MAG: endonuclease [Bacteroidales bacterium]|nr:endonuclease [Bacteroidales bacterium]MCF8391584.1 endonuclease [Bacteroidales bacterium]
MRNNLRLFILIILSSHSLSDIYSQNEIQIVFWNVENLFYPENDSLTDDDEFTPEGERHWSYYRYWKKINLLWKTILSAGDEEPPDIIGLCEIENRKVLEDLFLYSPLRIYNYKIVHRDSPDSRGIDVAMIYNADIFDSISYDFLVADFPELNGRPTREILHSQLFREGKSLHLYVNHWPSKYGGVGFTDILRIRSAELLLSDIQKVQNENHDASIICMGDFNDIPESRAILKLVSENDSGIVLHLLENESNTIQGSLKYQGRWEWIDHILVNDHLYYGLGNHQIVPRNAKIYSPSFLLEKDEKYGGMMPFRTYIGFSYNGGVSDHLPVGVGLVW